jgi:ribonuclease HI
VVIPGVIDSATLEALACREALALAADLQLTCIKVATDCLEVTSLHGNYMGRFSSVLP